MKLRDLQNFEVFGGRVEALSPGLPGPEIKEKSDPRPDMSSEAHAVRAEHAPSGGDGGARVSPHGRVVRRGRGALGRRTAL